MPRHRWYAAYTKPRNEKKVLQRLLEAGVETYLPLQRRRRRWSDRMKWVDEPLLPSYIFVRADESSYYNVINIPGMVRYVTFEGKAAPIPDWQIEALRLLLMQDVELEVSSETFSPGQAVIVKAGVLMGMHGEVVDYRGKKKILLRLGETGFNILVTVGLEMIEKL